MIKKAQLIFVTIKSRLYLSFFLLVFFFLVNGIITVTILDKNKILSSQIATVIDPATQTIIEFNQIIIESKMLSTNWVFIRSNKEDKDALLKLHAVRYPKIKAKLHYLAPKLFDKQVNDSLKIVFNKFENLIKVQKVIISRLSSFENYDDAFTRMEMEMKVEDEIIPQTNSILKAMKYVTSEEQTIRLAANNKLEQSSATLRKILLSLALIVIAIGTLFSIYLARIISYPIIQLRKIINDMGKGKLEVVKYKDNENEIGLMVNSVNKLSENLRASANFAKEIGNRNFSINFKPLDEEDILGKALITMRDNLKESDARLNLAQSIAKLGGWEYDIETKTSIWSDELFIILGYKALEVKPGLGSFMNMVIEEHKPRFIEILNKGITNNVFSLECKLITPNGVSKNVFIQGQAKINTKGIMSKIVGIVQDVTIQKEAEEKLQENNAQLLKTNKELDKFVYSVSHDLRAPLSSMLGIVQLTEEDCEDTFIKENLGLVKGSILKLDGFIEDILSYSRNARLDVKKDFVDFGNIVEEITNNLKYMTGASKHIKISANVSQEVLFKTDLNRLKIVLSNLISNSLRYYNTQIDNSFVDIFIDVNDIEALIVIEDNGLGIRKDLHERIFEMFYRVSENSVGSGLGLYIVKETLEKLSGTITVDSELLLGTKFKLTIPNLN